MDTSERPNDSLPPIGEATDAHVNLIFARRQAIINALALPLQIASQCRRIYTWGEDTDIPSDCRTLVNKIQNAVHSQVASHLKEPAKATLEPVETGEYADWYWCGPPEAAAEVPMPMPVIDPMSGGMVEDPMQPGSGQPAMATVVTGLDPIYVGGVMPDGSVQTPVPLPMALVKYLQQLGQQDVIDPQHICRMNDEYTAKTMQKQLDEDWRKTKVDKWLRSRVLANAIEGWSLPLYEFDTRTKQHLLRRNSITQTYIDQSCEEIDDAVEAGIDLYLDLDEAIALYPEHRDALLLNRVGNSMATPGTGGLVPVNFGGTFERPMVIKVVWWIRQQPVGINAAVEAGLVEAREVIDESSLLAAEGVRGGAVRVGAAGDQDGATGTTDGPEAGGSETVEAHPAEGGAELPSMPEGIGSGAPQVATRLGYFLPASNTEVTPASPDWPVAIRQISIVGNTLIEDLVCPFPDLPILHMRNVPVVNRPWGIGEPFGTKNLQDAYSNITTDAVKNADFGAYPIVTMPQALKAQLEMETGKAFVEPGQVFGLPDPWDKLPQPPIHIIAPPPFPESSANVREMIKEDFEQLSGRPGIKSGESPAPNASGALVANLLSAADEPLNFKAQEISYLVEKLAGLMLFSILTFKTRRDIAKCVSVPEPLLELVLQRAREREMNVKVTISTGAGAVIQHKRAEYVAYNQTVDPATRLPLVSGQTTREVIGVDPTVEERRNQEAVRNAAMTLAPMQQQQGGEQDGDEGGAGKDKPPKDSKAA